jgi:Tol biopolymer transport system component/DNA-binding winged helix-turn-helix (wHTH) protein
MPQSQQTGVIRFGVFEVDPQSGTIRKRGVRISLQEQPLRVLLALLEKPGEVVTREELQQQIWTGVAFGDCDHSLNIAVNKIREALGDSAETPRFVETLPRRGYRFIATVEGTAAPMAMVPTAASAKAPLPRWTLVGGAVAIVALIGFLAVRSLQPRAAPRLQWHRLTNDNLYPKRFPVLSDGARLYFMAGLETDQIFQIPVSGGEPARLPVALPPGQYHRLIDITPDGQELLVAVHPDPPSVPVKAVPLWTVRIADGASRRVGDLQARRATYSPDGTRIAFIIDGAEGSLWVASSEGRDARRLLELKGFEISVPRWSPDGLRIVFGQQTLAALDWSAWEISLDGTHLHRILPGWRRPHLPGLWTPGGELLLVSEGQFWLVQQRGLFELRQPAPVQLSGDEPYFDPPLQSRDRGTFYTEGRTRLGQLQRFDRRSGHWEPHLNGISAEGVEYSSDGQSLVYTTYPGGELWSRRADGSRPVQLTKSPMQASIARWSPDGRWIAFAGKAAPGELPRIYLVEAAGGTPRLACTTDCGTQIDFTWSPDGKKIVFGAPASASAGMHLAVLDLETGKAARFPDSEGLHSPRWSPDGSVLAAVTCECKVGSAFAAMQPITLYRFAEAKWEELPEPGAGNPQWPSWSHDGKSIWYWSFAQGSIMRYLIREQRHEEVLPLRLDEATGMIGSWFNLTANDEPMILRRRDMDQIYALQLKPR